MKDISNVDASGEWNCPYCKTPHQLYNEECGCDGETLAMNEKKIDELTAQRDALVAALRRMVKQCPGCPGEENETGTWIVEGKVFHCPICQQARAALSLVEQTAGEEG